MTKERYTVFLRNCISFLCILCFSFSFAGNPEVNEPQSDSILQPKPSPTTLYIVEGTQTNILETAELKNVKVVSIKKKTSKKTIQKKVKKPITKPDIQENGEEKDETGNTPFLNQSSKTANLLSVSFQQSVVLPTSYSPVKMVNYKKEALTLCLVPECNLVASTCYQISFPENQFRNAWFTRPPPMFIQLG